MTGGDCQLQGDGTFLCPPVAPDWGDECDAFHYDCGGDDCLASSGEATGIQGCNGGGGDGGGTGGDGDGGAGGGGGGSTGGGVPPSCPDDGCDPEPCDPSVDPNCERPLTPADSSTIRVSLRDFVRPDSAIPDTTARRECAEMRQEFEAVLTAGNVFRGGSNSTGADAHYGATYLGHIHLDPWLLEAANAGNTTALREVANTALHEAAHVLRKSHPNGATVDPAGHDVYSDPYFNRLSPGPNSCIRY